jgi:hypothetical protein
VSPHEALRRFRESQLEVSRPIAVNGSQKFIAVIGGAEGDRTPDLMTASHALSQLSYGPLSEELSTVTA